MPSVNFVCYSCPRQEVIMHAFFIISIIDIHKSILSRMFLRRLCFSAASRGCSISKNSMINMVTQRGISLLMKCNSSSTRASYPSETVLRLAVESDYEKIVKLSALTSDSTDITPGCFNQWLKDPRQIMSAAEYNETIISFFGLRAVDEDTTLVRHSSRTDPQYRGLKISTELRKYCFDIASQRFPGVKKVRYTIDCSNQLMQTLTKRWGYRFIALRDMEGYCFNTNVKTRIEDFTKDNIRFCHLYQYTAEEFMKIDGLEKSNEQGIVKDGLIFDAWWPLKPIRSNISLMMPESLIFMTDWRIEVEPFESAIYSTKSLSHGNCLKYDDRYELQVTVYSDEPEVVKNHILKQILYAYQHSQELTNAVITVYPGMREAVRNVCIKRLTLGCNPGYVDLQMAAVDASC